MTDPVNQLRCDRRHRLNAWLAGGAGNRWPGDDGRILRLDEQVFWPPAVKDAEAAFFAVIDADYEAAKAALG